MNQNLLIQAEELIRKREQKKRWYLLTAGFACIVALCVYAALILPAITMEKEPVCGVAEHTHTESCYETAAAEFGCSLESLEVHPHSEACYDEAGELVCGYADDLIHIHDEQCYDEAGGLVCPLPEVKEHTHSAECFEEKTILACEAEETEGHSHAEACYDANGELTCGQEETEGHTHGDGCYQTETVPVCGMEEIVPHTHSEKCYDESGALACGLLERKEHVHTEACLLPGETKLICGLEEHTHDDSCYAANMASNAEETNSLLSMPPSGQYTQSQILNTWRSGGSSLKSRLSGSIGSGTTIGGIQLAYKNVPTEYNFAMGGDMSGKTLQKTSGAVNGAPYVNGAKGYINYAGEDIPAGRLEDQGLNETWFYDLEAPSTSSNIWCLYPSVGTYYDIKTGKSYEVDVKLTLESWGRNTKEYTTNHNSTLFGFRKNQIGVACLGMDYFTIRYDFYKSGTSTKISVKGNTTFTDIDYAQGILIEDNTCDAILVNAEGQYAIADTVYGSTVDGKVYIYDDYTGTSNGNGHVYNPDGSNNGYSKSAAYTELFSGNSLKRTYTFVRQNGNLARGMIENEMDPVVLKDEALIIKKKISGATSLSPDKFPFTVEITDASGNPVSDTFGDVTVRNGKGSIYIGKDSFITIEDLKVGYTVIVTEDDNPNYDPDFDADAGSASGRSYTYKATGKGGTILVEVDNKIIDTGGGNDKITINKTVEGTSSSSRSFNFTVQITDAAGKGVSGTFGDVTVYSGWGTLEISPTSSKSISNLPLGYKVTVMEEISTEYSTNITASAGSASGNTYKYTATGKGAQVWVTVKNTFIDTGGKDDKITIEKYVKGDTSSSPASFRFMVQIQDASGKNVSGTFGDVTVNSGYGLLEISKNGKKTIEDLPVGYKVTVTEEPSDSYTTEIAASGGKFSNGVYTYTATGKGASVRVMVTNTMIDTGGKYDEITIKKTVSGETSSSPASFKFSVRIQDADDSNVSGTFGDVTVQSGWGGFELSKDGEITISDLPLGYKVTVQEEPSDAYKTDITASAGITAGDTYIYTSTGKGAHVSVNVDNEIQPVECELIIKKQANGFVVADREFVFDITIRDENNKAVPSGQYGDLTVGENGTGQLKISKDEEKTISSLKPGYKVTITEQQDGSFTTTVSGMETNTHTHIISVPPSTVTFTNYMTAKDFPLSIYKTNGTDPLQGAKFSLYAAYVYPNGSWIRDTASDIRPQFQTTDGEGKAVFQIPAQAGYYLLYEEEAPSGYAKPSKPWRLTVTADGRVTLTDSENKPVERLENSSISYYIINEKGYVLPETGGIGITVYTLGGLLLCAAGITFGYIKFRRREGDTS